MFVSSLTRFSAHGCNHFRNWLRDRLPRQMPAEGPFGAGCCGGPGRALPVVSASVPGVGVGASHTENTDTLTAALRCPASPWRGWSRSGALPERGAGPASAGGRVTQGPRDMWPVGGSRHRAPWTGLWTERGQGRCGQCGRDPEPLHRRPLSKNADCLRVTRGSRKPPGSSVSICDAVLFCLPHRGSKFKGRDFPSRPPIYPQCLRQCTRRVLGDAASSVTAASR